MLVLAAVVSFTACGLFEDDEEFPVYIHVEEYDVIVENGQGGAHQDISDVWVYSGSDLLGAYPLGVDIPILEDLDRPILLFPGIRENGIRALPSIHFMLQADTFFLNTAELQVDTLKPVFRYFDDVDFRWVETFEFTNSLTWDVDGNTNTRVERTSEKSFTGNYSGRMQVDSENPVAEIATDLLFLDMPGGRPVYLEMTYQTDHEFSVGLIGERLASPFDKVYKLNLNPTNGEWRTIVVNFQDEITFSQFDGYRILFGLFMESGHDSETATVYLDNLKLVHR